MVGLLVRIGLFGIIAFNNLVYACPSDPTITGNKRAIVILDFLATESASNLASSAECAFSMYQMLNLRSFAKEYPKRVEQLIGDVTDIQTRAYQSLSESGDIPAAERFHNREVTIRKRVLRDIDELSESLKLALRIERIRQVTSLAQAFERQDSGSELDEFLSKYDLDFFQSQTINSWLKSISSCPSWKISLSGGISDSRLIQDVCSDRCKARVKSANATIKGWQQLRIKDWDRNQQGKILHTRISMALRKCS